MGLDALNDWKKFGDGMPHFVCLHSLIRSYPGFDGYNPFHDMAKCVTVGHDKILRIQSFARINKGNEINCLREDLKT